MRKVEKILLYFLLIIFINLSLTLSSKKHKTSNRKKEPKMNYNYPYEEDTDMKRDIPRLIMSRGFHYELHSVTTEDGYILNHFRIINPYAYESQNPNVLKPVILQHGLFCSGSTWLINSAGENIIPWKNGKPPNVRGRNLGFVLANRGYDVWLTNSRGTRYSMNHTSLSPSQDEFWEFSFEEMADFDLPATIDYIEDVTHTGKIAYVGHSLGSLIALLLLSDTPEYSKILEPCIAISPVAFMGHMKGALGSIKLDDSFFYLAAGASGPTLDSHTRKNNPSLRAICRDQRYKALCFGALDIVNGLTEHKINLTRLNVYKAHSEGTSWKNLFHILQSRQNNYPSRFNFGFEGNVHVYSGKTEPPHYHLQNIQTDKLALISSDNDFMAPPEDVEQLRKALSGPPVYDMISLDYNHQDFIYSETVDQETNDFVITALTTIN